MATNSSTEDIIPINGPKKYSFTLSTIKQLFQPDWIDAVNEYAWEAGLREIERHQDLIRRRKIWSPWPILSYCIGEVEAPIPEDRMSPLERAIRQSVMESNKSELKKVTVRFFLFPCLQPESQSQSVAQIICEVLVGADPVRVRMWVDALGEKELTEENVLDIKSSMNKHHQ